MSKAQTKSGTPAVITRNEVVSNADLQKQIEKQQKMLAQITTASKFISFKGGHLIVDGKTVPGDSAEVILLAFMPERAYFPSYDPDVRQSPLCYSYREDLDGDSGEGDEPGPHPEAREPQAKTCEDCEFNKWGSAEKGKGKACRESLRLTLVPAQKDLAKAAPVNARIPITSVPAFKALVNEILGYNRPIYDVVVRLSVAADERTMFKINWDMVREVDPKDKALIAAKAVAAQAAINFPYPNFDDEEDKKPKAPAKQLKTKARR